MVDAEGYFDEDKWVVPALSLEGRRLGANLAPICARGLRTTCTVRYLNLKGNILGDEGMQVIMEAMKGNRTVEILDLTDNNVRDAGGVAIGAMLEHNTHLQNLILAGNRIRKTGAAAIAQGLLTNNRLKKLDLSDNRLRDGGVSALADALCRNQALQQLTVARNEVNVAGGRALAGMLTMNNTLQALSVAYNLLGEALVDFASALSTNVTLLELDLEANLLSAQHAKKFAEALLRVSLMTINLSHNPLGDEGMKAILDSLKVLSALRCLDAAYVGMTGQSISDIVALVQLSPQLESLHIDGNKVGGDGIMLLAAAMKEHRSLISLNVSHCGMDCRSTTALALTLNSNPLFTSLVAIDNQISDEGCHTLCYALKRLTKLRTLDLTANCITDAMMEELASLFVNNHELPIITLVGNPIANSLANGVLSRRVALQVLMNMPDNTRVLAPPNLPPPSVLSPYRKPASIFPALHPGSPSVMKSAELSHSAEFGTSPTKTALMQLSMAAHSLDDPDLTSLVTDYALTAQDEYSKSTYPPLIPSKNSVEHPHYNGFGRGRFCNQSLVQVPGDVIPYTIINSLGPTPVKKWCDSISTADAMFATPLRRVHKSNPYLERQLEINIGGLLVTERQLRDAFNELDVDGKGWIDRQQFEQLYGTFENFGVRPSPKKVRHALNRYTVGNSDRLNFNEFAILMLSVAQR